MAQKFQVLCLEDLQSIEQIIRVYPDILNKPQVFRAWEGLREAINIAERFHPLEYIVLGRAVFLRNERGQRRARAKRLEETLQTYGFTVKPSPKGPNGRIACWYVGVGDVLDPENQTVGSHKELKEAIAQAVAKAIRRRELRGFQPRP